MPKLSTEGPIKAGFKLTTKELRSILKRIKTTLAPRWKEQRPYCELTIKTNTIELVVTGVKQICECEAWGPAKVTISFLHLLYLVNDRPRLMTKVAVGDDFMTINETTVPVVTWFFKNDSILRSIDLPVNYDIVDILKLPQKYTKEELVFNKLAEENRKAQDKLYDDIVKVRRILKKYRITEDQIQNFVLSEIEKSGKTAIL